MASVRDMMELEKRLGRLRLHRYLKKKAGLPVSEPFPPTHQFISQFSPDEQEEIFEDVRVWAAQDKGMRV